MNIKKSFLAGLGILALPVIVSAQLYNAGTGGTVTVIGIMHAVEIATGTIFGGAAVVFFVIAGILFLTAQGDPAKIKTARSAFIWGIAGVVVGIMAFSIVAFVAKIIT